MNKIELTLVKEKEVKHSVRYKPEKITSESPFQIVYFRKEFLGSRPPSKIKVTLE